MASQTLVFVALPNGRTSRGTLKFSIYFTPRLEDGATLAAFPDILHWVPNIVANGLTFHFSSGGRTASIAADVTALHADIWSTIFAPDTFVEKYAAPDLTQRLVVSYPARDALSCLKFVYGAAGTGPVGGDGQRVFTDLLESFAFRGEVRPGASVFDYSGSDGDTVSPLDLAMSAMRVTIWNEQHVGPSAVRAFGSATGASTAAPPDGVAMPVTPPPNAVDTITRFALYHHLPTAPNRSPLPSTPADFAKTLDFHRALTALNAYPVLQRALGLVFDVEIPDSLCPDSPAGTTYRTVSLAKVVPGFAWSLKPTFGFPKVAYVADTSVFASAPATAPGNVATGAYAPGDIVGGLLALPSDSYNLVQVDLDGALLQTITLAGAIASTGETSVVDDGIPALRSAGISLMASDRASQLLAAIGNNAQFAQDLASGVPSARPLNASDVVRGFRIDIWSSETNAWHSLHRRDGTYRFGEHLALEKRSSDEEGFTQLAVAQPADDATRPQDATATEQGIPQPGTDLYLHERVAKWEGWSLSAPRPGKTLNRSADPTAALDPDPTENQPITPFKMVSSFAVTARSLPQLRFGARYRLRARAVDLAGNSIPLGSPTPANFALPANETQLTYFRFEPVSPPLVVLRTEPGAGGSLERLVIRSFNAAASQDSIVSAAVDERHIAPPKIAVRLAEHHGMFDGPTGQLLGDAATYDTIVARDEARFATQNGVPLESGPQLNVSYLPDPFAQGAALRDLPGTPADSDGRLNEGNLLYAVLPGAQPRDGSVTFIDFGPWPARTAFRLRLIEGSGAPVWDGAERTLTVQVPKAGVVETALSAYLDESDLTVMGVWNWLRETFEAQQLAAVASTDADWSVPTGGDVAALITRLVLEGGHDMITPARTLTLVHAVQQPLGSPAFEQLPVVHQVSSPIFASALRNLFTAITPWRAHGSHDVVLLGGLRIHGQSSAKIDLLAGWLEETDDVSLPGPTTSKVTDHVETIDLATLSGGPIAADATGTRQVSVYIPEVDTLWFAAPFDTLSGVSTPSDVAAPVHRMSDTKHRWVVYEAVATSRFQEYFPEPGLTFVRGSQPLMVDVPSSARPLVPDILYIVPTFGWEEQETTNVKTVVRIGNGLRVYLARPWYSSGPNELLGVVLWPEASAAPNDAAREANKAFFTQWGNDPIWSTAALSPVPAWFDFPNATVIGKSLTIAETGQTFDVAGHDVQYDTERRLWFCDIVFGNLPAYAPFVRLALARYQPHSIEAVELSRVALADYAQLTPNRSALLSIDPSDPRKMRLVVGGLAPAPSASGFASAISVDVEQRADNVASDLDWESYRGDPVQIVQDAVASADPNAVLWSGTLTFKVIPKQGEYRAVVREVESLLGDGSVPGSVVQSGRVVYAAIINLDFPSLPVR